MTPLRLAMVFAFVASSACGTRGVRKVEPRKLALGAEVVFVASGECGRPRVICVNGGEASVEAATSDAPGIVEVRQVSGSAITVRAVKEGVTRLSVQVRAPSGEVRQAEVWLEVKALTRASVWLQCEQGPAVRAVHAVPPGASFRVSATGFSSDDDELDTGALPLFEAAGFTVETVDGALQATAPSTAGTYAWTVLGGGSVNVRVYDAATVGVRLSVATPRTQPRPQLMAELVVDGESVCIASAPLEARLEATGACVAVASGVQLRGRVPLEIGRQPVLVELEGDGQPCTVTATLADGRAVSVTSSPPRVGVGLGVTPSGPVLTPSGHDVGLGQAGAGVVCTDGLSDGRCSHLYDGDCYVDSDWVIQHSAVAVPDAGAVLGERDVVGVGLRTALRLRVIIDLPLLPDIVVGPPKNLTYRNNHLFVLPGRAAVEDHRCPAPGTDKWHTLTVTPEAAGSHHFEFRAENLDDVGTFSFDAAEVTRVRWRLQDEASTVSTSDTAEVFVRSTVVPTAGYEGAGGRLLRGEGPLRFLADSPDGGSKATGPAVFTGDVPHVVTVSSALAGPAASLLVRDAAGIQGIGRVGARTLKVGEVGCVGPVVALGGLGRPVLGRAPVMPSLEVEGTAGLRLGSSAKDLEVCFVATSPGAATMRVRWGAASVDGAWLVVP